MPRIPESEIERMKKEVDLAGLVRSKGIELKKHGSKDLAARCPFHQDDTASLIVTPGKNLWHCLGCGKGGSVIDFVMAYDGLSFRHAYELLAEGSLAKLIHSDRDKPIRQSTVPKLDNPLDAEDDAGLMEQVIDYYYGRLYENPAALDYLTGRGISEEAIKHFKIGFADRTLGLRLPEKNRKEGAAIRERLQRLGLYRESGHEHFNGCAVFPIRNRSGQVTEVYGRKTVQKQSTGIYHLYLPGPHVGLLNWEGFASREIIICESIIDALTFWSAGIRNVTTIYGTESFTQELEDTLIKEKARRAYLAYDRDEAGNRAADRDAKRLGALGIECYRVQFPKGMDANQYALKVSPPEKSLALLIKSAQWFENTVPAQVDQPSDESRASSSLAAELVANSPEPATKNEVPEAPALGLVEKESHLEMNIGDRFYRVRGLEKNQSLDTMKINLRVSSGDLIYLDSFDLYTARAREHFVRNAAEELMMKQELIKRDVGKLLLALEEHQESSFAEASEAGEAAQVELSPEEKEEAMELLRDPGLLDRIISDFEACGIVGETTNKLTGYLAAVSRKLDRPLAIIIQSTSAAGKTSLMEAVLAMMPQDEKIKYSAMTGQSLYYLGETNLKHKILAIVEEEGAEKASYALKLLQSEGELTIASTGKDETGRMKTEEYHVEGPVMIFLTTTAIDIDEELLNRCLVLTVDESREQTEAIHRLQREAETLDGLTRKIEKDKILSTHANAQRLLKPVHVVNPFAPELSFMSSQTRARRDHMKYLILIRTIALLHQHQREIKTLDDGQEYIEVTRADIEAANKIANEVLARSLDELPPQTRKLLHIISDLLAQTEASTFSRSELRECCGWGNTQLKTHLARLVDMEYLQVVRHPEHIQRYLYELTYDPNRSGLKANWSGQMDNRSAPGRGAVGGWSAPGRSGKSAAKPDEKKVYTLKPLRNGKSHKAHRNGQVVVT